jgi:hypothetical protein
MGGGKTTVVAEVQAVVNSQALRETPRQARARICCDPPAFRLSPFAISPLRNPTFVISPSSSILLLKPPVLLSNLLDSVFPIE